MQRETDVQDSLDCVSAHCSELLIHAADVEGLCRGIDEELVAPRRMGLGSDDVRGRRATP